MGERIGLSSDAWELIGPLLPPERGRGCRAAGDNRPLFEGMMWMARTGSQWRQLPDEYGKWNSVFRWCRGWVESGVFDAMMETLAEMAGRDRTADTIDSTIVWAHHCAVGKKRDWAGRSTRPLARWLHHQASRPMRRQGRPLGFVLTPGEAHDVQGLVPLFRQITGKVKALLADRGYDADAMRPKIALQGIQAVIPAKRGRKHPALHDRRKYRLHSRIKQLFTKLKNWRRIATRYDKTRASYLRFVSLASAMLWLPFVHEA